MTASLTRRQLLVHLAGVSQALLLAACRPSPFPTPAPTTAAGAPASRSLRFGTAALAQTSSPYPGTSGNAGFLRSVFDSLVTFDAQHQPAPGLAESWSFSDDRRRVTLTLREGVVFHSGRPFTADDAVWNMDFARDPKTGAQAGGQLSAVQARALDARTLELATPEPLPQLLSLLLNVYMVDPESDVTQRAGGTGPFKIDSLQPGVGLHLVRHTGYWRSGRPWLNEVSYAVLPDAAALALNLEAGAVDVVRGLPLTDVRRFSDGARLAAMARPTSGVLAYILNTANPQLSDVRVRRALDLAIDRSRFAQRFMLGFNQPTFSIWPRRSPVWDASLEQGEFNLDGARQLLSEAGSAHDLHLQLQTSPATSGELFTFQQAFQADLERIGVDLQIEALDVVAATALLQQGTFTGLTANAYGFNDLDPALLFVALPFRTSGNVTHFGSEAYTQMVDAAAREVDWPTRLARYRDIARFVREQAFVLPLGDAVLGWGLRTGVRGFDLSISGEPLLGDVELA